MRTLSVKLSTGWDLGTVQMEKSSVHRGAEDSARSSDLKRSQRRSFEGGEVGRPGRAFQRVTLKGQPRMEGPGCFEW